MAAGDSAALEAARRRLTADEHARLAGVARQLARSFEIAAASERRLAQTLLELEPLGFTVLADRRWPGARRANVDFVLVGPSGVVIVDAKHWSEVHVARGGVWRGQADVSDEIARTADIVYRAQERLAEVGLPADEVRGVTVFTSHPDVRAELYGVRLLGEAAAVDAIARLPHRLAREQVAAVRGELESLFPPLATGPVPVVDASIRPVVLPAPSVGPAAADAPDAPGRQPIHLTPDQVFDALLAGVLAEPVESWMTFLHPAQARIVRRSFSGPSRVRGAAGTGKTVVALHRAAHLARTSGGRVLVTTFVATLPKVLESLFARMAPDLVDRVEFRSVHSFAFQLLADRGRRPRVDSRAADAVFDELWAELGARGPLGAADPRPGYWRDELHAVIKGRGLTDFADYARLARVGRRRALGVDLRREMWRLYCAYEAALRERGIRDFGDLVLEAEASLAARPVGDYDAVIVDEAQDLTCAMVRLLAALVGDRPDGLHLVGDGQQSVYPGGYTLAEAGISVAGRGVVLATNYRNTAEIVDFATRLVDGDEIDDIEGVTTASVAAQLPDVLRTGSAPVVRMFPSRSEHDASVVAHVRARLEADAGVGPGDIAVLALRHAHAREAAIALETAGIRTMDLEDYDGTTTPAVKIGTIKRAKGLEFKEVLVVRAPGELLDGEPGDDDGLAERRDLERRELYVALTRARDGIWVGVA